MVTSKDSKKTSFFIKSGIKIIVKFVENTEKNCNFVLDNHSGFLFVFYLFKKRYNIFRKLPNFMMSFLYRTRVNNLKYRYGMASPINIEDYYTCGWYTVVGVNEMDE